ncbi:MAG: hypothetical protein RIQ90_1818 [Bacteroidota bacterium]
MEIKQKSGVFYNKLLEFDEDPKKEKNINYVKELLYKFSYSNLEDVFDDAGLIRKSVINYLYTGFFTLSESQDITDEAKQCLSKILKYEDYDTLNELEQKLGIKKQELEAFPNDEKSNKISEDITKIELKIEDVNERLGKKVDFDGFYKKVHDNWSEIHKKHKELISQFTKTGTIKEVKYLIVYEAPPYNDTSNNYFLISNGGNYGNPIKECFSNSKNNISDILVDKNAIYFDLIMAGIPIKDAEININGVTKPIRYFWSTDDRWKIGEKQLPIILLELGIFHLFYMGVKFDKRPFIAIGTPLNTSASLFEYYSKNYLKVYYKNIKIKDAKDIIPEDFRNLDFEVNGLPNEFFTANLSLVNTPSTFEIRKTKGETYPLFKSNFIGSSNFPNGSLLKNAFNII